MVLGIYACDLRIYGAWNLCMQHRVTLESMVLRIYACMQHHVTLESMVLRMYACETQTH